VRIEIVSRAACGTCQDVPSCFASRICLIVTNRSCCIASRVQMSANSSASKNSSSVCSIRFHSRHGQSFAMSQSAFPSAVPRAMRIERTLLGENRCHPRLQPSRTFSEHRAVYAALVRCGSVERNRSCGARHRQSRSRTSGRLPQDSNFRTQN
jgi:hypothetical protein